MSLVCKLTSALQGIIGFGVMAFGHPADAQVFFLAAILFYLWSQDE